MSSEGSTGHGTDPQTFLITGAQQSLDDQHRARVRKYLTLMAFRVPALVIAGIVYSATGNGLLALAIVAASIPIPWVAVLIANDRPPRKRGEVPRYQYGVDHSVIGPAPLEGPRQTLDSRIVDSTVEASDETSRAEHDRRSH